jgi:hypothetical protein
MPLGTVVDAAPSYPKETNAPIMPWYEYRSYIAKKDIPEYWTANSKIALTLKSQDWHIVDGSYGGYFMHVLESDFTFGWNIQDFDKYDGIIVEDVITPSVYLRKEKRYDGIIIARPRLPFAIKYPKEIIESVDGILLNFSTGLETVENLNKVNKTQKFFLFVCPAIGFRFLVDNFYAGYDEKTQRIITYRVSSGPSRADTSSVGMLMMKMKQVRNVMIRNSLFRSLYMRTVHSTARKLEEKTGSDRVRSLNKVAQYLEEFQRFRPDVQGFMTRGHLGTPKPFIGIDIPLADDFYDYVAKSHLIVLPTSTGASMLYYGACVGTPCVGSKDTTLQSILFPELAFDENDVESIVSAMMRLFRDKDFYISQQKQGLENAEKNFSLDSLRVRFRECTETMVQI